MHLVLLVFRESCLQITLHITISIAFERAEWSDKSGIISI